MRFFLCIARHIAVLMILISSTSLLADGPYHTVEYPASGQPGELEMGVTYTVWLPEGVKKLRGVIVHQHGCGTGACQGGQTAAHDLHWQALARKWDCALLGPSYQQAEQQNCRLWCDPRNGSAKTFLRSLEDLSVAAKHPELKDVPWVLWGHSGGAFWSSLMQTLYPERIAAIWFRSGGAIYAWEKGEIPRPDFPDAAFDIPVMCNPGLKERDDPKFAGAWIAGTGLFKLYRERGAPIGFAADPKSAHDCGDSRYLAIPWIDACLELRLPGPSAGNQSLRKIDQKSARLASLFGDQAVAADQFTGEINASVWLPNERIAKAWAEYVADGKVSDDTPPAAPDTVSLQANPDGGITLTWNCAADLESGIHRFVIRKNGTVIGQVPEKPLGKFGRPTFQSQSYHDTPEKPLPEMKFVDPSGKPGDAAAYEVIAVNTAGRESKPTAAK